MQFSSRDKDDEEMELLYKDYIIAGQQIGLGILYSEALPAAWILQL